MIITFTAEQAAELLDDFWDVDYTVEVDGVIVETSTGEDDIREFPIPRLDLGLAEGGTYQSSHPLLTPADEAVIKAVLDERVAWRESVAAAPQGERAGMRQAKRAELRTAARQDQRREARRKQRIADRQAAREAYRAELRERYADAIANSTTVVLERPNVDDLKAAWVDYAKQEGIDTAGMTKQEIIDAVDAL